MLCCYCCNITIQLGLVWWIFHAEVAIFSIIVCHCLGTETIKWYINSTAGHMSNTLQLDWKLRSLCRLILGSSCTVYMQVCPFWSVFSLDGKRKYCMSKGWNKFNSKRSVFNEMLPPSVSLSNFTCSISLGFAIWLFIIITFVWVSPPGSDGETKIIYFVIRREKTPSSLKRK